MVCCARGTAVAARIGLRVAQVLQCVAVCCSVLQFVAICCSKGVAAVCCSVMQPRRCFSYWPTSGTVCCSALQYVAACYSVS